MDKRWSLWDEMKRLQDEMDSSFDHFFRSPLFRDPKVHARMLPAPGGETAQSGLREPLADIWESKDSVTAAVEIPGVDKDDISIHVTDGGLEIKAEKKAEKKEVDEKKGMYRFERSYGGFYRYFQLPKGIDTDNVDASYKNGVLEVRIPKLKLPEQKAKKIQIK